MTLLQTEQRTTHNGASFTAKSYSVPGLTATVIQGDPESFGLMVDSLMTFYPQEVREIAAALIELADAMEQR